jgi:hypothetical protein
MFQQRRRWDLLIQLGKWPLQGTRQPDQRGSSRRLDRAYKGEQSQWCLGMFQQRRRWDLLIQLGKWPLQGTRQPDQRNSSRRLDKESI